QCFIIMSKGIQVNFRPCPLQCGIHLSHLDYAIFGSYFSTKSYENPYLPKKPDMKTGDVLIPVIFTDEKKAYDKIMKEFDRWYGIYTSRNSTENHKGMEIYITLMK
ncbi:MAG: hypothetical protein SO015_09630, partial [Wujia sp.]